MQQDFNEKIHTQRTYAHVPKRQHTKTSISKNQQVYRMLLTTVYVFLMNRAMEAGFFSAGVAN